MPSAAGSIQFNVTQTTAVDVTLETEFRRSSGSSPNEQVIDVYMTLDPNNEPRKISIEVNSSGLLDNDILSATITAGGMTEDALVRYSSGMSVEDLAYKLAKVINLHSEVVAIASGTSVHVTSAVPGQDFTVEYTLYASPSVSGNPSNMAETEIQPNVGEPVHRKLASRKTTLEITSGGTPALKQADTYFDGGESPAVLQSSTVTQTIGPRKISDIISDQGISL